MKLSFSMAAISLFLSAADAHGDEPTFRPHRIPHEHLDNQVSFETSRTKNTFLNALSEVGVLSVRDVPGYASAKNEALGTLHACATKSGAAQDHEFPDGTVRKTLATHTVPGPGGAQKILSHETAEQEQQRQELSDACRAFIEASDRLRSIVAGVTQSFADRLGSSLDVARPLLTTRDGSYAFDTMAEVVESGEHLEHFHSYQRTKPNNRRNRKDTVDLHTDQGLFIAFTPGFMANKNGGATRYPQDGGFYFELKDGSRALADFDEDDLVFMLGDGVHQVINAKVRPGGTKLRAVPHALTVPDHGDDEARVWYGRMVLPPQGAIHPDHGKTFGELRRLMIDESLSADKDQEKLGIGCSSSLIARQMEETTCEAGTIYCWHRCMNHTDPEFAVTDDECASRGLRMECVNPRDQVWVDDHGDYFPGCTNSTEEATPYPKLPTYPREESACPSSEWEAFASDDGYDHAFEPNKGISRFMWTKLDGGKIKARLAFNGIFGYLAFGLAGPPGSKKNGMHGASVILALPGDEYSAVTGLDLTKKHTVQEYEIHPTNTAFRHWQEPVASADTYEVDSTGCFTAITFETDFINGNPFNVTGTDKVLWAGNAEDYYAGGHGTNRSMFCVQWSEGKAFFESKTGAGCDHEALPHTETNGKTSGERIGAETAGSGGPSVDSVSGVATVLVTVLSAGFGALFL